MIDNTLMIKNLLKLDRIFMIFSQYTRMPYVECDPETFDDQIHIFSDESEIQEFAKAYTEQKILLMAKEVPNNQIQPALASMFAIGVNAIVLHHNSTVARLQVEDVVKKPDMEKLLKNPLPVMNPTLTLSALYFLEELHRPVAHDKEQLKELEEEMIANLLRAKYILAMSPANPGEKLDPKNPKQPKTVNYIKDKDGQLFLAAYTDLTEFQKFHREKSREVAMLVVDLKKASTAIMQEAKGLVINPAGYRLQIGKEQLLKILEVYGGNE